MLCIWLKGRHGAGQSLARALACLDTDIGRTRIGGNEAGSTANWERGVVHRSDMIGRQGDEVGQHSYNFV